MGAAWVLHRYFATSDLIDGLLKGVGVGLMIGSLVLMSRKRKCASEEA